VEEPGPRTPPPLLEHLRLAALLLLVVSVVLAGWIPIPIPGTMFQHRRATLALFDVLLWPALALVLFCRCREAGWRGIWRSLGRAPVAGWFLVALAVWSGLVWQRAAGAAPLGYTAVGKKLMPLVEYGLVGFVVFAELARGERARKWALAALSGAFGLCLVYGAAQYFVRAHDFEVGSFLGNRNALGAFLAAAVPFFAVMAVSSRGWEWRIAGGVLAGAGTLLAITAGAVLGIICGVLVGTALAGRRRWAIACASLLALLALGQLLPRRNLSAALESARLVRKDQEGNSYLAMRYLRAGYEVNILRAGLRAGGGDMKRYFFGLGPGGYGRDWGRFRPQLDERGIGETDEVANYDVLANEPGTFNLFGVAGAELGLLGVLGFLWLFAFYARTALKAWRRAPEGNLNRAVALAAFAAAVGAFVASPFSSVWIRGAGPLLILLVGLGSSVDLTDATTRVTSDSSLPPPPLARDIA